MTEIGTGSLHARVGGQDKGSLNGSTTSSRPWSLSTVHSCSYLTSSGFSPTLSSSAVLASSSAQAPVQTPAVVGSASPCNNDSTRRLALAAQIAPPPLLMRSASSSASLCSISSYGATSSSSSSSGSHGSSSSPVLSDVPPTPNGSYSFLPDGPSRATNRMDEPSASELDRQLSLYREELRLSMASMCRAMIRPQKVFNMPDAVGFEVLGDDGTTSDMLDDVIVGI